ncbi:LysR family transcriptional regulator [Neptunomonas sp. CHC150]|uniref:LysR family transcriptional regulator n=1 Tax=Neptunomonas TaxID=75687 RepID=UPI000948FF9F|nr:MULTISPECIES: LysR family transcriptional regulator [Neptunomonas]MDN2659438.1 LysR family transcriptional regulator [Neptunomonas sp. CHC150]
MELYQLKSFVKVAELGNLTRASEALFTSQPAISAQIKALEEFLGVQLFVRSAKGMNLTEAGNRLYDDACVTLAAADKLHQRALLLRDEIVGELKIGIHTDFDFVKTGALYQAMKARCPQLNLHFYQTSSATIIRPLRTGEFDAGFSFGPKKSGELSVEVLTQVPLKVVIPKVFSPELGQADLATLAELPWVYTSNSCPFYGICEALFAGESVSPQQLAWVDTEEAMVALVKAGAGLSILREDMAARLEQEGLAYVWEGEVPEIEFNFVTTLRRQHDPLISLFRECIYDCWQLEFPKTTDVQSA